MFFFYFLEKFNVRVMLFIVFSLRISVIVLKPMGLWNQSAGTGCWLCHFLSVLALGKLDSLFMPQLSHQ